MHSTFIKEAIALADKSIDQGGGPFGAVIVKEGKTIAAASNKVTLNNDPTAHAEVVAIREACSRLGTFDLSGCTIYTSCEPCPMCLGAIYWARIDAVYYALDREDAARAGFDDRHIYEEMARDPDARQLKMVQMDAPAGQQLFRKWMDKPDKTTY